MGKKQILISIIIVAIILLAILIWAIAYPYFSSRIDDSTRQSFINETMSYLSTNEDFVSKYGSLISIDSSDKLPIKNENSEQTQYYMDFTCVTENGHFYIRVYHTWDSTWSYSFDEINGN